MASPSKYTGTTPDGSSGIFGANSRMKPIYVILGLTYDCNSFCRTCFNWEQLRKDKEHELSTEELLKTIQDSVWKRSFIVEFVWNGRMHAKEFRRAD